MIFVKRELRQFSSRYKNGVLMYPGERVLIWAQVFPGVWRLVEMSDGAA